MCLPLQKIDILVILLNWYHYLNDTLNLYFLLNFSILITSGTNVVTEELNELTDSYTTSKVDL